MESVSPYNYIYVVHLSLTKKTHVKEWDKKSKRREKENFDENHFSLHPYPNPKPLKKFPDTSAAQENKGETMVKEYPDSKSWTASQDPVVPPRRAGSS